MLKAFAIVAAFLILALSVGLLPLPIAVCVIGCGIFHAIILATLHARGE